MNRTQLQAMCDELTRLFESGTEASTGLVKLADNSTNCDRIFDTFAGHAQARGAKLAYATFDPANLRHHLSAGADVSVRRHATYTLGDYEVPQLSDRLREGLHVR